MAYGLWDAFFLPNLPGFLDGDQVSQAARLCDTMTRFLQSEACLKWVEMAIIINYTWGYTKLFGNVIEALEAAEEGATSHWPSFRLYSVVRRQFFADYAYVIYLTGPSLEEVMLPDGFGTRTMAAQLLSLGNKWAYLYNRQKTLVLRLRQEAYVLQS